MKNVPDELLPTLARRPGDLPLPGNSRWGKTARLSSGTAVDKTVQGGRQDTLDFVHTGIISNAPTPIAVKLRFSLDGRTFTPEVPATFGGNVIVEMTSTIDMKSGAMRESTTLEPGDAMTTCAVLAMGLNVTVRLDAEDTSIYVQVVAAPTTAIDCADVVGPAGNTTIPAGFRTTTQKFPAATVGPFNLLANPLRAYLMIVNHSAVDLSVFFEGSSNEAIILPANVEAGYDVENFRGSVSVTFSATDAGFVSITEGTYA